MILLIDNYDSFVYNLYQYISAVGVACQVIRNDKITVAEAQAMAPQALVISPGPGRPTSAGISLQLIRQLGQKLPILGVCLGHQAIGEAFGGEVIYAPEIMHGKISPITHSGQGVFAGLASPLNVTRYHSLIVCKANLPPCLEITAQTEDGLIMGLRHREYPIEGVQFHPESIASESGKTMIANFLKRKGITP